jgi:hypothetical protein
MRFPSIVLFVEEGSTAFPITGTTLIIGVCDASAVRATLDTISE